MRAVQTYILRLLVDPGEPEALRGALQPIPEGANQPFASEKELLALLHEANPSAGKLPRSANGKRDDG